mmetsp:Transcript_47197/g.73809  ORF Transcript_47197/g.73809 Transcript_47197/m.73809 type:complete len:83 (+) Transcript_47197:46-294(+)|eukprot:CAMPEP_0184321506 /NCGR_PEP_ID=MMETSP1049-20130417/119390_1 /TAXON_ID=77928 /ORGANISM="Proteomonas sulcata, Strain CCMP704" /LENGTH=82 /DNA_ID=CAMNT_0026642337 /DNA_START=42 /DNA_END=290 /DNA_ORIENTATION=-
MGGGASKQAGKDECCAACKPKFEQLQAELAEMKKEKSHAISELQELKVEHERLESLYKNMRDSKKDLLSPAAQEQNGGIKLL